MKLEPFAMERMQSTWENRVAWNLSESGVHPLRVEELADTDADRRRCSRRRSAIRRRTARPELRRRHRVAVSGRDAGAHRSHERRLRGQLHRRSRT